MNPVVRAMVRTGGRVSVTPDRRSGGRVGAKAPERAWQDVVRSRYPCLQGYVETSGRQVPLAVLSPVSSAE